MNKTMKRMLSAVCALAMSATAAVPVFAGTGTSAGAADGGVVGRVYRDFESFNVGDTFPNADPEANFISTERADKREFSIIDDNENKVFKVLTKAGGSAGVGVKLLTDTVATELANADYWVVKYDLKNGDSAANKFADIKHQFQFRNDGESIEYPDADNKINFTPWTWHEFMFIGKKSTGKVRLVLDGKAYDEVNCNRISFVGDFYGIQIYDSNSDHTNDTVMYIDDMEIYGVVSQNRVSTVQLTADADNSKVYADFDYPVTGVATSNVAVTGGASASSVEFENGRYVISLSGVQYGSDYTVTLSGVTDVFGTAVDSKSVTFTGKGTISDGVVSKVTEDFEQFAENAVFTADQGNLKLGKDNAGLYEYKVIKSGDNKILKMTRNKNLDGAVSIALHNPALQEGTETADYWVHKFDIKNGDSATAGNAYPYINTRIQYRLDDGYINFGGSNRNFTAYDWHEFTFIGKAGTNEVSLLIDGEYIATASDSRNSSANDFFYVQIYETDEKDYDQVAYFDNFETYGVKTTGRQNLATLTADNANAKLYATFTTPVKAVTANDIQITGAAVDSVTYDKTNARWEIALKDYKANTKYNVTLNGVEDVFGTTTIPATAEITTPRAQMKKTYLATPNGTFKGYEDFEGYDKTGVFKGANEVIITRTSDNKNITDVWTNYGGKNNNFEVSLADAGENNHAYKITALNGVANNDFAFFVQPQDTADWTVSSQGKCFIYEVKFKSGDEAKNESAFSSSYFEVPGGITVQLVYTNGSVVFGGAISGTVENAFNLKEWNTLKYVVDYTSEKPKAYILINDNLIGQMTSETAFDVKNGDVRFGNTYSDGTAGATLYLDDVAVYTIDPMKITEVVPDGSDVKVTVVSSYGSYADGLTPAVNATADLWVAVYDEDGSLATVKKAASEILYGENDYTAAGVTVSSGQSVKAFIWGGANSITPLCDYKTN